ncbi:hypothetical protein ANCCAN_05343 [Ancylostoma caninum]|uniref:Protein kinase domain-containing protein n=1 Tax=Ancylostoma caninum TaxID=29170 RepID=A0A368GY65_ANCCA|nr:hypothetical protein ANCCAN_05343 [Ancylostoma caninum]
MVPETCNSAESTHTFFPGSPSSERGVKEPWVIGSSLSKLHDCELGAQSLYWLENSRAILIGGQVKIADFGLSKLVNDLEKADAEQAEDNEPSPQIPLRWMAPESLRRPMKFSTKSDVWSFAVMIYEIFNYGLKPWPDDPPKKIATAIRKCQMPPMPEKTPEEVKGLVSQIWIVDPNQRPDMKQVCSSLSAASRKYPAPPPQKFTLNSIKGVTRISDEVYLTREETAEPDEERDPQLKTIDRDTETNKTKDTA